jgi:hypothetical protein
VFEGLFACFEFCVFGHWDLFDILLLVLGILIILLKKSLQIQLVIFFSDVILGVYLVNSSAGRTEQ